MKSKVIRKIFMAFFFLTLLAGLAIVFIPMLQIQEHDVQMAQTVQEWKDDYEVIIPEPPAPEPKPLFPELLAAMQEYNRTLHLYGQSHLGEAWSYQDESFDLTQYGVYTDIVGIITIPAIEVELPLFLGSTYENLGNGFAQLNQTSMPIGGTNTNCVVACHRGWNGSAYMRHADKLQIGDRVYLQNFWGTLTYQVYDTKVILPHETEEILIQDGRDILTMVTCTPYGVGSHRLLIYCERVDAEDESVSQAGDPKPPIRDLPIRDDCPIVRECLKKS